MNVYCGTKPWTREVYDRTSLSGDLFFDHPETLGDAELNYPEFILFLHWHWIVPPWFVNRYNCIGFHSAPLPQFRGGSPIQNQLKRGILDTKLTAFKLTDKLDGGPILCDRDLSLRGSMEDIFGRIKELSIDMITQIKAGNYVERPQVGAGSYYSRADAL